MRPIALALILCVASPALAEDTPARTLVELARQLAARPNDPRLHAQIALAYFQRGAAGDAERVQLHAARAAALDPAQEALIARELETAPAGFEPTPPSSEAQLADMQAAASLPAQEPSSCDALVRSRLASRIARSQFRPPSTKYSKNIEAVEQLYDPATDPDASGWPDREGVLRRAGIDVRSPLMKRFIETLRRNVKMREERDAARKGLVSKDDPPDPMLTKGQAFLAYIDGDVTGAVAKLESTAAAADTIARRAAERASDAIDDAAPPPPQTPAPQQLALATGKDGKVTAGSNAAAEDGWNEGVGGGPAATRPALRARSGPPLDDDWGDDSEAERARVATPARTQGEAPPRIATPPRTETPQREEETTPPRVATPDRTSTPERTADATPPRAATPERTDASTPPRADTPPRDQPASPQRAQTPQRGQLPQAPPEALRSIGQQSLESLEATKTKEVAPPEVGRKLTELARTGEVGEPLVIDLDGDDRPSIPGGLAPDGRLEPGTAVRFDVDGDGHAEQVEWMRAGDGLLCQDLDGDGRITSGRELPGAMPGHGSAEQWLAARDLDGDGILSGRELEGLSVWKDDGDGICQPGELLSLGQAGIERILIHGPGGMQAIVHGQVRSVWEWWPDTRP